MSKFFLIAFILLLGLAVLFLKFYYFPTEGIELEINGKRWQSYYSVASKTGNTLIITGDGGNTKGDFLLLLPANLAPGRYTFRESDLPITLAFHDSKGQFFSPFTGELTIEKHDTIAHIVRGRFAFNVRNINTGAVKDTVSNGYFSLKYDLLQKGN